MLSEAERSYHRLRAQAELALAEADGRQVVAQAHRKLAQLHMNRLKTLDEACDGSAGRSARPQPFLDAR